MRIDETAAKAAKAARDIIEVGIDKAMNLNNTTKKRTRYEKLLSPS